MEFTADRNLLAATVASVAGGIPANPGVPVLAGMRVTASPDGITVTAGDTDVTYTAWTDAAGDSEWSATVPGRLFADIVKSLPAGEALVSREGNQVSLRCGRSAFGFRVLEGVFPSPPLPAPECGVTAGDEFADAVKRVLFAVAKNDAVPAYGAVSLEASHVLDVTATDRYCLATAGVKWLPGDWQEPSCLVPAKAAERFCKGIAGDVAVGWDSRVVTLSTDGFQVTARLVAGNFPQWRTIMGEPEPHIPLDAAMVAEAVRRAMLVTGEDDPVELAFGDGQLRVSAAGAPGNATEVLPLDYHGEEFTAPFGARRLADALAACGEESFLGFSVVTRPAHIRSGALRAMILPRRKV